jgi:pyruvate/2-oxoglutarate dehydrogenase complex dihydrolipoamide dehydrogenase (E3) component
MNYTVLVPLKNEFEDLRGFLAGQVEKLGVRVHTGQAVDGSIIDQVKPDVVVMATGSRPIIPDIAGLGAAAVKTAEEIISGAPAGKNVIVIGGGAVGCETAEVLADRGAKVTVIEMLEELASDMEVPEKMVLMQRLGEKGVTFLTKTVVKEVKPGGEVVLQKDYQPQVLTGIETIVLAVGYAPATELEAVLKEKMVPYVKIGDCVEARKAIDAIWEGFFKAYEL